LVRLFAKPLFRKICDSVCRQIQDGDGLFHARFGGTKSIVQQRGVVPVRTQRNCFRESVGTLRRARSRLDHAFAGREVRALLLLTRAELDKKNRAEKQKDNFHSSGQAASNEP
jgi:hypothetical protein